MSEWTRKDMKQRLYVVEGEALDTAESCSVQVIVNGKKFINMTLREPGVLAIISRPDEQGIRVVSVEPAGVKFDDRIMPASEQGDVIDEWAQLALFGVAK